jgi:hypothetical protein
VIEVVRSGRARVIIMLMDPLRTPDSTCILLPDINCIYANGIHNNSILKSHRLTWVEISKGALKDSPHIVLAPSISPTSTKIGRSPISHGHQHILAILMPRQWLRAPKYSRTRHRRLSHSSPKPSSAMAWSIVQAT